MKKRLLAMFAPIALLAAAQGAAAATIVVTKTATCGCCRHWVEHLRKAGFTVEVHDVEDVSPTARRLGVPDKLRSCHTAEAEGYAIEGHVPAADVKKLLAAKPRGVRGIAVPGMVAGSPGMESANPQPYNTIAFDKAGKTRVFASH